MNESRVVRLYSRDPVTGKTLFCENFPIRTNVPMTQEEVDRQCRLVSECPEVTEEEERVWEGNQS